MGIVEPTGTIPRPGSRIPRPSRGSGGDTIPGNRCPPAQPPHPRAVIARRFGRTLTCLRTCHYLRAQHRPGPDSRAQAQLILKSHSPNLPMRLRWSAPYDRRGRVNFLQPWIFLPTTMTLRGIAIGLRPTGHRSGFGSSIVRGSYRKEGVALRRTVAIGRAGRQCRRHSGRHAQTGSQDAQSNHQTPDRPHRIPPRSVYTNRHGTVTGNMA